MAGPLHRAAMKRAEIPWAVGQAPGTAGSGISQPTGQYLHGHQRSGHPLPQARLAVTQPPTVGQPCQLSSEGRDIRRPCHSCISQGCHQHSTQPQFYSVSPSPSLALRTPAPKIFIFHQTSLQQGNTFLTMTFGCYEFCFHLQTKQDFFFFPKQPLSVLFY